MTTMIQNSGYRQLVPMAPTGPSGDAAKILALPHGHHPKLAALVRELATRPDMTTAEARKLLDAAAADLRLDALDIEYAAPGARAAAPFVATAAPAGPGETFDEGVRGHLHRIIQQQQGGRP